MSLFFSKLSRFVLASCTRLHYIIIEALFTFIVNIPPSSVLQIRWPKYWSFSFRISPSNEYSGLIYFRIYWFDLLAVLGALKSLLRHHSLKAAILWRSAFFMVQLSHLNMTTGKIIALTIVRPFYLTSVMWAVPGRV